MDDEVTRRLARLFPAIEQRWGRCGKKLPYATAAQAAAVKARREAQVPGLSLQVYACEDGDHWHLSSQPQTPAQQARLRALSDALWHGMAAELRTYRERRAALTRQAEALACRLLEGSKRVARVPPSRRIVQELTARYEAHRDDWVRFEDVEEQRRDLDLRRDQILAWSQAVLACTGDLPEARRHGPMGDLAEAIHQAFTARCTALVAMAEAEREAFAAGMRRQLEHLDAAHAENLARARAYLTAQYLRPSYGRGGTP